MLSDVVELLAVVAEALRERSHRHGDFDGTDSPRTNLVGVEEEHHFIAGEINLMAYEKVVDENARFFSHFVEAGAEVVGEQRLLQYFEQFGIAIILEERAEVSHALVLEVVVDETCEVAWVSTATILVVFHFENHIFFAETHRFH